MKPGPLLRLALVAAALGAIGLASAQNTLPKDSPFMPTGGDPTLAAAGETIEFAGVIDEGKKKLVNLYDKAVKKSHWIGVGETLDGFNVLTYDERREQVVVKVGGEQKVLTLRKSSGATNAPSLVLAAPNPTMNFNVPTPASDDAVQKIQPPPPPSAAPGADATAAMTPVTNAAAAKPDAPAAPPTIAKQEEEARMLVSDLLEIGMAQRKAYEEKQKAAASQQEGTAPPAQSTPPPANSGG